MTAVLRSNYVETFQFSQPENCPSVYDDTGHLLVNFGLSVASFLSYG